MRAKRTNYITSVFHRKQKQSKAFKRRNKKSPKKFILIGLFFSVIAILSYFLVFWTGWEIEQISISLPENSSLEEKDIVESVNQVLEKKYFKYLSQKNIILTSVNLVSLTLKQSFPQIEDVQIEKKISPKLKKEGQGSSLKVSIVERESVAIWCKTKIIIEELPGEEELEEEISEEQPTEDIIDQEIKEELKEDPKEEKIIENCYYLDKNGIIFGQSPIFEGGLVLSIYDFRQINVKLGNQILPDNLMAIILNIKEKVPGIMKKTPGSRGLGISNLEIYALEEMDLLTNEGWKVIFNANLPATNQLTVLQSILFEEIKENRQALEYIDLRIENRAYYK